jgi:predicted PurR-regulated permease PerM
VRKPDPALFRLLIFLGGLVTVVVILIVFRKVFLPLMLGLLIAYLLDPAVGWFERKGRSRLFGVIIITLALVVALLIAVLVIFPALGDQLERLAERMPEYQKQIRKQIEPWFQKLEARYPEELAEIQDRVVAGLRENLPDLAGRIGIWFRALFSNIFDFLLFLLNLIFVPVFAFYLLVDFPKVRAGISSLLPLPYREMVLGWVGEVDAAIASFLRGQLTIAMILACINAVGLMILGVPFGLGIGLLAGLANMIPYMALIVGLGPGLVLSWAEHQSWLRLIGVLIVFCGAQLLEGTVLSPKILSRSVNLHPVWVLLAIIAGGSLFGFFGMLIAVPVAAAVQVFARNWIGLYKASAVYRGIDVGSGEAAIRATAMPGEDPGELGPEDTITTGEA